jgi:hypothetical protein
VSSKDSNGLRSLPRSQQSYFAFTGVFKQFANPGKIFASLASPAGFPDAIEFNQFLNISQSSVNFKGSTPVNLDDLRSRNRHSSEDVSFQTVALGFYNANDVNTDGSVSLKLFALSLSPSQFSIQTNLLSWSCSNPADYQKCLPQRLTCSSSDKMLVVDMQFC